MIKTCVLSALAFACFAAAPVSRAAQQDAPEFLTWAPTPPMGWNSWDYFGTTLNEANAKKQADAQAEILKPHGWDIFTVDIQWYEGASQGHGYAEGAKLTTDEFSRLCPAVSKFPSAANGKGFKPLADYVHSKGLRFGIHIMRGIPRQAVKQNTPIKGTTAKAADIGNPQNICPWNPDMYGVDMTKPGAQEYYDSLFELYASWGVDFVKVDDISRPYDDGQKAEIEAIHKAIDKSGRKIVLSLSPGDTPLSRGDHVNTMANMWRISDDFWDVWHPLHEMFGRLDRWTKFRREGAWPDADMLPFGNVEFGRPTRFTPDEVRLCMTLWCIARSPLILGADMTKLDPYTRSILTNDEVLAVSQKSKNNRQLSRDGDHIVWTADVPDSKDKYVALFNAGTAPLPYDVSKAKFASKVLSGEPGKQTVDVSASIKGAKKLVLIVTDGGNGFEFDHGVWVNPTLRGLKGSKPLTQMKWTHAETGFGTPQVDRSVEGHPLLLDGKTVQGIGVHSKSIITYDLPEGYDTFEAQVALLPESEGRGSVQFYVLTEDAVLKPEQVKISVPLADLGITGRAKVRDLWAGKDLGTVDSAVASEVPAHGVVLFRVSPE